MGDSGAELDVLVVEDSETDSKLIVRELRRIGYEPRWERVDSVDALGAALARQRWDLVISDSSVPGMSVIEALGMARRQQPGIPFIAVSGTLNAEAAGEALRLGASACLGKDHLDRLGEAVTRELARARSPESTAPADIAHRIIAAQEEERRRIARLLHDEFGQLLVALRGVLEEVDRSRGPARKRRLHDAVALVDQAIEQARDFYAALWPVVLDDLGLPAALQWLAERHARSSGAAVDLDLEQVDGLSRTAEIACFRVAQEALANCARHARARRVEMIVRARAESVELVVHDDGCGFDSEPAWREARAGASLGLLAMRERAEQAGGKLEVVSSPGDGTTVRATLPRGSA